MTKTERLTPTQVDMDIRKMQTRVNWQTIREYASNVKKSFLKYDCKLLIISKRKGRAPECVLRTSSEYAIEVHTPTCLWAFSLGPECDDVAMNHALGIIVRLVGASAFVGRRK